MCVTLAEVAVEVVEALLPWSTRGIFHAQPPLSDQPGGVPFLLQEFRNSDILIPKTGRSIPPHSRVSGVLAGHQDTAGGGTNRKARIGVREPHALGRHTVEMGGLDEVLPVRSKVSVPKIVSHDPDDVGRLLGFGRIGIALGTTHSDQCSDAEHRGARQPRACGGPMRTFISRSVH